MPVSRRAAGVGVLLALGATLFAGSRRVRRYTVAEASMAPTLQPGDYVIAVATTAVPDRGEIVVFPHPERPEFELVKRVVGLPGETITVANGNVNVDGGVLAEPWADGPTRPDGSWSLGPREMLVLGDRRGASIADGRILGPVPVGSPRWRVVFRYWPVASAGRIAAR